MMAQIKENDKAKDKDEALTKDADMRATEESAARQIAELLEKRKEEGKPLTGTLAHEVKAYANSLRFYNDKINRYENENAIKGTASAAIVGSVMDSLKNLYDPLKGKEDEFKNKDDDKNKKWIILELFRY